MVQGVSADGQNWSYSKNIDSDDSVSVTAAEVAAAGATGLSSFENCEVWLEKPVEDGGTLTYAVRADTVIPTPTQTPTLSTSTNDADCIESAVDVDGRRQRIRVYNPDAFVLNLASTTREKRPLEVIQAAFSFA